MTWRTVQFGDFVDIQPRTVLEKGEEYSFVEMADLQPYRKDVAPRTTRVWSGSGGAKFRDGDTLLARITPCLENGKTAKVSNLKGGVGFGSTEFIVFRAKPGISDPDYVYYLARSQVIRGPAIKSMIGASGRQRARENVIGEIQFNAPPLKEQVRIGKVISAFDDLIENNRRRIALLEQSARLLYREWFVHLRFPGHEHVNVVDGVPEGWDLCSAFDAMEVMSGGTPKTDVADYWHGEIPFFTPKDAVDAPYVLDTEKHLTDRGLAACNSQLYPKGTIFITARGTVGNLNLAQAPMAMNQSCYALKGKGDLSQFFLFSALKEAVQQFKSRAGGAVFDAIVVNTFKIIPFLRPPQELVREYTELVDPMFHQIDRLLLQSAKLREARDLLLPRLMSGDLVV